MVKPVVKSCDEKYEAPNFPPKLKWWEVLRGEEPAGQLLGAFELLQVGGFVVVLGGFLDCFWGVFEWFWGVLASFGGFLWVFSLFIWVVIDSN